MIKALAVAVAPEEYAARLAEAETEKATWTMTLPIFYYNDCLFSGAKLDLHLFEPRYRIMMRRVVESNRRFAYVCSFEAFAAKVGDVALVAEVRECEFLADGRALLSAGLLAGRHEVIETYVEEGTQGLHYCRLAPLKDHDMSADDVTLAIQVCVVDTYYFLAGLLLLLPRSRYPPPPYATVCSCSKMTNSQGTSSATTPMPG